MKEMSLSRSKILFFLCVSLFGCLGPVVKAINLSTASVVWLRAWISGLTIMVFIFIRGKNTIVELKRVLVPMIFGGVLMCGDWLGLFLAYNYTTIAVSTVCYYMAPILIVLGAAVFLKEKITGKGLICILTAFAGLVAVSGIIGLPGAEKTDIRGPLLSVFGALCYAGIVIINKKHSDCDPILRTAIQLVSAALLMTPYILLTEDVCSFNLAAKDIVLLVLLGAVLTAADYILYFSLIVRIPSGSVAILSYADPLVALIISIIFMHEPMTLFGAVGTTLIIGASVVSERIKK